MHGPGGNARSGHVPVDDDNDGVFDEDGADDLNGNGVIEQIRKYVPGQGNPQAERARPAHPRAGASPARRATTSCSARRGSTTTATAG